jgi:tRNA threonylcarbamoyladenosine biosynthesis protein TsaE
MSSGEKGEASLAWRSDSEEETIRLGRRIGRTLVAGDLVALTGPLGSGKTRLVKGIALGLGVADADSVTSPTFVYLRIHSGRVPLYHFDAYRLDGEAEFLALGGWELLGEEGVSVVEWADRLAPALPVDRIDVDLRPLDPSTRELLIRGHGKMASRPEEIERE